MSTIILLSLISAFAVGCVIYFHFADKKEADTLSDE
jgi:hypothetical protein